MSVTKVGAFMKRFADSAILSAVLVVFSWVAPFFLWADADTLTVSVSDPQGRPVSGLEIGLKAGGGTGTTIDDGKTTIPLAQGTAEHSFVLLQVVSSPPGKDWALLSPYDSRVEVPSFDSNPNNFVGVTVVERRDRSALADGQVISALVERVNSAGARQSISPTAPPRNLETSLKEVAKQYGFTTEELDRAIRAWTPSPDNLVQLGQKALYERNYPEATQNFEQALAKATKDRYSAAFFLGYSRFEQGMFQQAAAAYDKCLEMDPINPTCLNNKAVTLSMLEDNKAALPLLLRARVVDLEQYGPNSLPVADCDLNIGSIAESAGDYHTAERFYDEAGQIYAATIAPNDPKLANFLNAKAAILEAHNEYAPAESNYRRAIDIDEGALGPTAFQVAILENNLASVLRKEGRYAEAERQYRAALDIDRRNMPANSPQTAEVLDNLAGLLKISGRPTEAQDLYQQSIQIKEQILPSDSPSLAKALSNLGVLFVQEHNYSKAEPLLRKALQINSNAYTKPNQYIALSEYNLGVLLKIQGKYSEAQPLLSDALSEDQAILGPDDATSQMIARSVNDLSKRTMSTP